MHRRWFAAMNVKKYLDKYQSGCQFCFSGKLEPNDGKMVLKNCAFLLQ